jgi:hypothetical protein
MRRLWGLLQHWFLARVQQGFLTRLRQRFIRTKAAKAICHQQIQAWIKGRPRAMISTRAG